MHLVLTISCSPSSIATPPSTDAQQAKSATSAETRPVGTALATVPRSTPGAFTKVIAEEHGECLLHDGQLACAGVVPPVLFEEGVQDFSYSGATVCLRRDEAWSCTMHPEQGWDHIELAPAPHVRDYVLSQWFPWGCGLTEATTIECAGHDPTGQQSPPDGEVRDFGVGAGMGCALMASGKMICWGTPLSHPPERPFNVPKGVYTQLATGPDGVCAERESDGFLDCSAAGTTWSVNRHYEVLEAGDDLFCGLAEDGSVYSWGVGVEEPTMPLRGTFVSVACHGPRVCAATAAGEVHCTPRNLN